MMMTIMRGLQLHLVVVLLARLVVCPNPSGTNDRANRHPRLAGVSDWMNGGWSTAARQGSSTSQPASQGWSNRRQPSSTSDRWTNPRRMSLGNAPSQPNNRQSAEGRVRWSDLSSSNDYLDPNARTNRGSRGSIYSSPTFGPSSYRPPTSAPPGSDLLQQWEAFQRHISQNQRPADFMPARSSMRQSGRPKTASSTTLGQSGSTRERPVSQIEASQLRQTEEERRLSRYGMYALQNGQQSSSSAPNYPVVGLATRPDMSAAFINSRQAQMLAKSGGGWVRPRKLSPVRNAMPSHKGKEKAKSQNNGPHTDHGTHSNYPLNLPTYPYPPPSYDYQRSTVPSPERMSYSDTRGEGSDGSWGRLDRFDRWSQPSMAFATAGTDYASSAATGPSFYSCMEEQPYIPGQDSPVHPYTPQEEALHRYRTQEQAANLGIPPPAPSPPGLLHAGPSRQDPTQGESDGKSDTDQSLMSDEDLVYESSPDWLPGPIPIHEFFRKYPAMCCNSWQRKLIYAAIQEAHRMLYNAGRRLTVIAQLAHQSAVPNIKTQTLDVQSSWALYRALIDRNPGAGRSDSSTRKASIRRFQRLIQYFKYIMKNLETTNELEIWCKDEWLTTTDPQGLSLRDPQDGAQLYFDNRPGIPAEYQAQRKWVREIPFWVFPSQPANAWGFRQEMAGPLESLIDLNPRWLEAARNPQYRKSAEGPFNKMRQTTHRRQIFRLDRFSKSAHPSLVFLELFFTQVDIVPADAGGYYPSPTCQDATNSVVHGHSYDCRDFASATERALDPDRAIEHLGNIELLVTGLYLQGDDWSLGYNRPPAEVPNDPAN